MARTGAAPSPGHYHRGPVLIAITTLLSLSWTQPASARAIATEGHSRPHGQHHDSRILEGSLSSRVQRLSRIRGQGLASVVDDPHFTSPYGVPFDFHGDLDQVFCLSSDERLHINALLKGYKDKRPFGFSKPDAQGFKRRTWMKELGILWKDAEGTQHVLHLVAREGKQTARGAGYLAKIELDGKPLSLPYDKKPVEVAGLSFQFIGVVEQEKPEEEQEEFFLRIANEFEGGITMRPANPQLQTKDDAEVHFNLNFGFLNSTDHVHGLMGQSYRSTMEQNKKNEEFMQKAMKDGHPIQADQVSGKGFLDGAIGDYIASEVTKPDCKFSQFQTQRESKPEETAAKH